MTTIRLSLAAHWLAEEQILLEQTLREMSSQLSFDLETEFIDWRNMWTRLSTIADTKQGPMVSEVGSTWVASFDDKGALNRLWDTDIEAIGGEDAYLAWEVGAPAYQSGYVGVPWMADSQIIYYWKDMVDAANVDVQDAFSTLSNFDRTLERLSRHSLKYPWAISTTRFPANLHQLACWIWGVGGELLDDTGQMIRFMEDEAIQAIVRYFSLHRFIPEYRSTSPIEMATHFAKREAAVTMGGVKVYHQIRRQLSGAELENVGVSLPPGIPFVGCETLVLWSHTPGDCRDEALQVIEQLMSPALQRDLAELLDLIPTSVALLRQPPYNSDPFLRMLGRAVAIGRSYPAVPAWGEIENQLLDTIVTIWDDIFSDQNPDVDNIVRKHLIRLSQSVRSLL